MNKVFVIVCILSMLFLTSCSLFEVTDLNETFKDYRQRQNITDEINITIVENVTSEINETTEFIPTQNTNLRIASFNVQIFGVSKASNPFVMDALGDIIEDYDIIAFQEIRDASGESFPKLMREELPNYNYVISDRLGRSKSKEEYSYIYKPEIGVSNCQVFPDKDDVFEREPYICEFLVGDFRFVMIQIHTKPNDASEEIKHLRDVVEYVKTEYNTNDIIILGDLNADNSYYKPGHYLNDYYWLIGDEVDTTTGRSDATYDRIISIRNYDAECFVDNYDDDNIESYELVEVVSDHFLIFCEINI